MFTYKYGILLVQTLYSKPAQMKSIFLKMISSLTPRRLVLKAVQRKTAASRSAKPLTSEQHSLCLVVCRWPHEPDLTSSHTLQIWACLSDVACFGGGGHGLTGVTRPKKNVMLRSSKMRNHHKAFEIPISLILKAMGYQWRCFRRLQFGFFLCWEHSFIIMALWAQLFVLSPVF